MSGQTIEALLAAAQAVPYHATNDLYLTGFCAERGGVDGRRTGTYSDRYYRDSPKNLWADCLSLKQLLRLTGVPWNSQSVPRFDAHYLASTMHASDEQLLYCWTWWMRSNAVLENGWYLIQHSIFIFLYDDYNPFMKRLLFDELPWTEISSFIQTDQSPNFLLIETGAFKMSIIDRDVSF